MMEAFLYIRQKTKAFFYRNESWLLPAMKFLLMLVVLLLMNWHLGYRYMQMRWVLVLMVSLIACLLPWSGITVLSALYLVGHVSALSWEGVLILLAVMFAGAMFHYLFLPGNSILIVLVPLAFYLKAPYLLPLLAGLFGPVLCFIPLGVGVVIYYLMLALEQNAAGLLDPGTSVVQSFSQVLADLAGSSRMLVSLVAVCLTALLVYWISHRSFDYARYISVAAGGILQLLCELAGGLALDVPTSYAGALVGCVLCTLLAELVSLWGTFLDYSRAEFLQYEDDEYMYYVKAVPKIRIAEPEPKVQEITSRRTASADR